MKITLAIFICLLSSSFAKCFMMTLGGEMEDLNLLPAIINYSEEVALNRGCFALKIKDTNYIRLQNQIIDFLDKYNFEDGDSLHLSFPGHGGIWYYEGEDQQSVDPLDRKVTISLGDNTNKDQSSLEYPFLFKNIILETFKKYPKAHISYSSSTCYPGFTEFHNNNLNILGSYNLCGASSVSRGEKSTIPSINDENIGIINKVKKLLKTYFIGLGFERWNDLDSNGSIVDFYYKGGLFDKMNSFKNGDLSSMALIRHALGTGKKLRPYSPAISLKDFRDNLTQEEIIKYLVKLGFEENYCKEGEYNAWSNEIIDWGNEIGRSTPLGVYVAHEEKLKKLKKLAKQYPELEVMRDVYSNVKGKMTTKELAYELCRLHRINYPNLIHKLESYKKMMKLNSSDYEEKVTWALSAAREIYKVSGREWGEKFLKHEFNYIFKEGIFQFDKIFDYSISIDELIPRFRGKNARKSGRQRITIEIEKLEEKYEKAYETVAPFIKMENDIDVLFHFFMPDHSHIHKGRTLNDYEKEGQYHAMEKLSQRLTKNIEDRRDKYLPYYLNMLRCESQAQFD